MSDFFIPTQNNDDYWTKKQKEIQTTLPQQNTQNDYWGQRSQALQQQKEERLANYNRYGVDVPDEYYEQFNKIISQVEDPAQAQEEAYRIGSAIKYSQMYGMPIEEAYTKVDALNEAQFPDLQDQKGRFEAICDMFTLGNNNVKLGMLGQKLMTATGTNDTEMVESLMAQIDALQQENVLLQDKTPRKWVMQALEAGAQSLPFTSYVAGAGVFGNFIAPGVGTGAAFATSSYLAAGQEYLDMRANGASHETAAIVSTVSGLIQGLIEADLGITNGIVKGTAKAMGKEAAERAAKKSLEDIGTKIAKRFHFGPGKKLLVNYLKEYGKNVLGEGTEEFLQEITSIIGQEVAASLDGYDIPEDDFNHIVKQTTEAFKGGVLGAISMGFIPAGINGAADIKSFKQIKDIAEEYESGEMFKEAVKENPVFEGMSDEQKADVLQEVWEKAQQRKEADVELEARQIAETRDAAEGAEEMPETEEGEETQAQSVARDESGRLYTNDDGNTFLVGDATKDDANRYGYIKYSTDENGDITIDTFKMTEGREGLREELFDEFAREHPDVNINWNAVGSEAQAMRQSLIDNNPSGAKNGLNYYSSQDLDQVAARKKVAAEVRKNIHNVTKNADGSFTRTDLSNDQVAAAVTLIESAAKRMDMSLSDYVNKTFGNQIFGSREQFAQSALAQGDQINDKAGGMNQGVAQANWREVGQQVKAVIYAGENADFSTWAHEMAHVFQNQLAGDLKTEAESAFNVVDGDWIHSKYTFKDGRTMSSAEAFAYGFQDWLETGKAENAQMQNIFQKFAQFIADCYNKLRQHLNFTPEIESVFNKLLDGDDTIMSKALKAAQEEENEYRASLKRKAEEAENTKKAEAEEAQKQAELEKEEAGEYTDYEQETTEQSAEEIEAQLEEGNEKETGNAIDNALENLNISDEQKAQTAEVLKDETSTIAEKADAIVDAAGEQFDLFQKQEGLLYQLAGEPSIRRMAESEERTRILNNLEKAKELDEKYENVSQESKAAAIRRMTGWEKDATGKWKYELDDSINRIKSSKMLDTILKQKPEIAVIASQRRLLNLGDIYDAPELYKVFPYMKNVRVSFYLDNNAFRSVLTGDGIKINARYLMGIKSEKGLKGALVHEIQHVIQTLEYAESNGIHGAELEKLYNEMKSAIQAVGQHNTDYDFTSVENALQNYMENEGEIEARNVARRILMNADERRYNTLASTEDVKRQPLLYQDDQTMYGIHNLSEDALRHALKMGGLANPSMAVVDTEKSNFTNFGEISLIPYNYMLEKGNGSKGTYGADIYSPRYPDIKKTVTPTGEKKINALFHGIEDQELKTHLISQLVNRIEESSRNFDYAYSPLSMAYLADKGNTDFIKRKAFKYSEELRNKVNELGNDYKGHEKEWTELYKEWRKKELKKEFEGKEISEEEFNKIYDVLIKQVIDPETGNMHWGRGTDFVYNIFADARDAGKLDYYATERAARELVENDPDFEKWAKDAYDRIEKEEKIFNGFTPSGNRRYLAHTLENVSKYMRQQELQGGESFYYGLGSTRAKFTPNFKTLNQIKKARDRLVTHEEFEKIKEEYNERFENIIEKLRGDNDFDTGAARFEEAFTEGKNDPIGYLEREYKDYGVHMTKELAEEILDFATALRQMPTEYFETKYTRPVYLNEFAGAIVPSNLSQDLKNALQNEGLLISEYNNDEDREQVTKDALKVFNQTRNVLFQIAGEIGAQNLDKSETQEGVSRMQNLAIAKDMEADGKDAKAIRLATGWEKGTDGYWRYEIADGTYFRPVEGETTVLEDGEFKKKTQLLNDGWLPQVYKSDELYKAYPDLEYVNVIYKTLPNNIQGRAYNANGYKIELNKNNSEEINKSVIIHEIQHIIQSIEGFARGGTEEEFNEISVDEIKDEIQGHQNNINLWKKDIKFDTFLANSMREVAEKKKTLEQHWKDLDDYVNKSEFADQINAEKEKIEELKARIEEIEENALDGTVEFQGNIYDSAYEAYRALAGEIESRNVESRINFTPEQRINTLIAETEDVAPEDKIILFQVVYHGSGANFDKFDTENYGLSGEGSMSFGYGTYLTDSEEIARDYANRQGLNLNNVKITDENSPYFDIAFAVYRGMSFEDAKEAVLKNNETKIKQHKEFIEKMKNSSRSEEEKKEKISFAENRLKEDEAEQTKLQEMFKTLTIDDVYKQLGIEPKRNLYTVEIPDDGYLNWDDQISKDDTKKIVDKFVDFMMAQPSKNETKIKEVADVDHWYWKNMKIEGLYNTLGYGASARTNLVSQFLHSIGYTGIKYPAGTIHGNGNGAYNYVIFNDDDAKIIDHLLFQTNAELMQEAQGFESWQDFMEFCEVMHSDDEVSPIPSEADAQWYQSFWETAHGLQTEQEKNEQAVQEKNAKDTTTAKAMDALFVTYIRQNPEMLDDFLHEAARIDAIDLDSDEWRNVEDDMDAAQRDRIDQLKDAIGIIMSDYNWQSAMNRVQGGGEISEGMRKRLMGEMTDTFKSRDFRALYAEVMEDPQYAVDEADTTSAILSKKLQKYQKRYYDIVKPGEDISRMSPEKRKQIAEAMANRDIANKIRNGSLKLDDELDAYIKSLDAQIKEKQKQFDELEKETKADYQRIADAEKRRLLKLHEELLMARSKVTQKNSDIARKINKGLKITEKYQRQSQNLQANYDELFRKFNDLKNTIQITAEVQAALDRQEQVANVREDLNAKQKEKNLTAEVKKMRIQLVKKTMRRVPFNRIDYDNAKTVIAIQRMLEPNLIGGVNKFIGIDSPFLRGVISQIVTDSEYRQELMDYLNINSRASEAFMNFKKKLSELKSIKDFDSWTAKDRKAAIRYLPKENWVRDLNLKKLAKEREESIDLDIDTQEYSRQAYDENGKPKTYKDKDGMEHNVYETAFRLRYSDELGQLVKDAVGADMFDRIVNRPFSEWTTEELEQLAQRIDELYTEGRDLLAAKNEARKREAEAIRKRVEDAIKETGIVINDDDTPEEKERKQKEINKILNLNSGLKGTEAGKEKVIKAKLDRLIHGYSDMNVLRFARMLDNQSEGENVYMLYRREDECYNNKTRSINNRARAINEIMKANKITEGDLAKSIAVPSLGTEFTVDELLYFLAADKDYVDDEKKLAKGLVGLEANDDWAATSRNAVMFGNMMSDSLSQEQKERWVELDKEMELAIKNDTLTAEQKQLKELGQLNNRPGTSAYISYCHAAWAQALSAANSFIAEHPEYKALMEAIEADYAAQYERMNEVSINEFNMPVHRVKAYVPLVRRESNGDTNVNQVKEDLLGAYGADAGKQWVNKGMTQRRVQMNPLHQKPVQTGLFATWGSSVDRTEHFIAYAPYVRQLNAVYKSRDASYTRRFIESRYGKNAVKYLDDYINEVANPNAGKVREAGAEWLHTFRGRTAPAYLGWKFSAIIKQGLTSPWPYMQFVNPAEYASAALECTRKGTYDAIREKSVFMNNRVMDPMNELIEEMADEGKTKFDRALGKFGKKGMAGLEWIDWVCVAPGWLACYKKEYARLQRASEARYDAKMEELRERNMYADIATSEYMTPDQMEAQARKEIMEDIEVEAVRYADDCTRQCQPSSRAADLAPLFKNSSEAMKAFLQFQTSLNVIWQNIRYDMPYAVRNKQFQRIVGTILGYVFAGIFMNSVMDGVTSGADDDDDKDLQALRNLVFYSTTQFTDAIPMIGSEVTNTMDQIITGKRGFMQSGTDMTPSATKLLSVLTNASKGNWEKAATLSAEAIGMAAGAPVSGLKEINKLLGKPLEEGDVNLLRGLSDVYGIAGDIIEE